LAVDTLTTNFFFPTIFFCHPRSHFRPSRDLSEPLAVSTLTKVKFMRLFSFLWPFIRITFWAYQRVFFHFQGGYGCLEFKSSLLQQFWTIFRGSNFLTWLGSLESPVAVSTLTKIQSMLLFFIFLILH
jgi:hypothetical protein